MGEGCGSPKSVIPAEATPAQGAIHESYNTRTNLPPPLYSSILGWSATKDAGSGGEAGI